MESNTSDEEDPFLSDVEQLKRAWRNEKAAPEVLMYQEELVSRFKEKVESMEDVIERFAREPSQSIKMQLYTMDMNRISFLLKSYLKARLGKIENYSLHICKDPDTFARLSPEEQDYASRYVSSMDEHFRASFLRQMPRQYQSLLEEGGFDPDTTLKMVPQAPLDSFVFCRTKEAMEDLQMDNQGEETLSWEPDELFVIRYRRIRRLLEENKIDLI